MAWTLAFPRECALAMRTFLRTMGSLLFLERASQSFRKRSCFAIRRFCVSYRRSSSIRSYSSHPPHFSFFSYGFAKTTFFFPLFRRIDSAIWIHKTSVRCRIISAGIHNLLTFTEFISCPRAEVDFFKIFYISAIFIPDDIFLNWRFFLSNFVPFDLIFYNLIDRGVINN